jgi:hypothetical protein
MNIFLTLFKIGIFTVFALLVGFIILAASTGNFQGEQ